MNISNELLLEVLAGANGHIGLITLNRPAQLNAITQTMCRQIRSALNDWKHQDAIKAVVIRGAGNKAFSAGGDIRHLYVARSEPQANLKFIEQEYALNAEIYHFSKPYISFMQGFTMGGGAGLSIPGKYRIASETLKFAMPETKIGFFTDVGASYFLTRCKGKLGWYLGLTGKTIHVQDAYYAGLVDVIIQQQQFSELLDALVHAKWTQDADRTIQKIIPAFAQPIGESYLQQYQEKIDYCFSQPAIESIIDALSAQPDQWLKEIGESLLRTSSPMSLKVVLEQLNRGVQMSFNDCMRMEHCIADHFFKSPDLYEGIRAAVIDKDHLPNWTLKTLSEITEKQVLDYFEPPENHS